MMGVILFAISYAFFIILMQIGWRKVKPAVPAFTASLEKISVIIVGRNEEKNIARLFSSLTLQTLPKENYEIIFVDDQSEDQTIEEVRKWENESIRILELEKSVTHLHKKNAIEQAIAMAKYDIIVLTDADCWMGKNWLMSIADYMTNHGPKALLAPVQFSNEKGLFQRFQQIEFASLMASTASFVGLQQPIMANGANIAFQKAAFFAVNGYKNDDVTSGDDVFLVHKLKKHYGKNAIHFLKNAEAIVFTQAQATLYDFIQQRIRWTSKNKHYKDWITIFTGFYIYFFNLFVLFSWIFVAFYPEKWYFLFPFFSKLVFDAWYFLSYFRFSKQLRLLMYYLPVQILNTLYVVGIVALSLFSSYEWRGRRVKI